MEKSFKQSKPIFNYIFEGNIQKVEGLIQKNSNLLKKK